MNKIEDQFKKNRLKIAVRTLAMPDTMVGVMGGMTKQEAEQIVLDDLKEKAAEATEVFSEDDLERYAEKWRKENAKNVPDKTKTGRR